MKSRKTAAFTLIELLVVIAIIAILLAVLIPSLEVAKKQATAIICLGNVKALSNGWYLYAEDNDNWLMDGDTCDRDQAGANIKTGWTLYPGTSQRVHNFVSAPQDELGNERNNSIEDKTRGFEVGAAWPYAETPKVYHCPSDKRYLFPAHGPGGGIGGYRSYSLGAVYSQRSSGAEALCRVDKLNQIAAPGEKFTWLEEMDGFGWNHRTWNMDLQTPYWVDPFAIWHNDRSTFGFADGHAEKHQWMENSTIDLARRMINSMEDSQEIKGEAVPANELRDWEWARKHYIPGKIPPSIRRP
ncbi:MAG: type II secretion system protein [Phycisphaerae bacterium]|nr:type II secretion system protein [Phycisphaerae bacterium]